MNTMRIIFAHQLLPRWWTLFALAGLPAHAADLPKVLDAAQLSHIVAVMQSPNSKFQWSELAEEGDKVMPYFESILKNTNHTDRVIERALIFTRYNLITFDCARLVDPTVTHLTNWDWEVRAAAMQLLSKIGGLLDCSSVSIILDDDTHFNRMGAAEVLITLGGRRELLTLDLWLSRRAADAKGDKEAKLAFEYITKSRNTLRERLDAEAKKKPVEPTEADKVVAKFADADAKVRAGAVGELKKVGSRADSSAVVALLHDPDAAVREAAAGWLGEKGGKRELVALEIRIREKRAADDPAFDAFAQAKKAVAERVEAEAKKAKDAEPKAKPPTEPKK